MDDNTELVQQLSLAFPRMLALSPKDRASCARDIVNASELRSWRETAAAIAAGLGREEPEWLDSDDDVVERP